MDDAVDVPTITLAGKVYSVPKLVPRQQRIVLPALLRATPIMLDIGRHLGEGKIADLQSKMTTETFEDLLRVTYWGVIWPNDKKFNYEAIYDMAIDINDLLAAAVLVQKQTGLYRAAPEGATPGESNPPVVS